MMLHVSRHGHPEQPGRISAIRNIIRDRGLLSKMKQIPIREVKKQEALLVHSEEHWDKVLAIQAMTPQDIIDSESYYESLSLYVMGGTTRSARLSCGGVIEACLAVARGELQKTFAIVRPPGHHAEPEEHMGFCFFNNVAVAAKVTQLLTPVKKILILDWDVHHGNGTQRAFNDDPSVLYISLHRYERGQFYPCGPFGSMESSGEGPGLGYSVNIPWPKKGMGDPDYIHAFQQIVMPIAMEFAPELVIISAGFDAAAGDDLGECFVTPAGYAHMTHMLSGLAGGKLVVALEGGYNLDSISRSALAVADVLLGNPPPELPPQQVNEFGTETVWQVAMEQSKYWKSINPKACEPRESMGEATFSIPEILKAHRQHYLYTQYKMLQVPLMTQAFEERFGSQVICSSDILEKSTMVVFIHEFGNLRVELDGKPTCDVRMEHSYLIDFSKELIGWIHSEHYSLLDINLFPRPFARVALRGGSAENLQRDLLTYLWDNYIRISQAKRIVIIGHGPGCQSIVEFLENRQANVMKYVDAVIQVVGQVNIPVIPKGLDALRSWYEDHSLVILHSEHPVYTSGTKLSPKRYGRTVKFDEQKPIKLMMKALPFIRNFMKTTLNNPV
ncbi:histone deacetylase clr3 [Hygrophoropsis aurantiaca]|uniref:Histone deacetylase clr3 n=1 Tax=Hygrophoropsis aurantiaca TaxID=72124 RepID=A0ACB8AL23_9AGAM|nr:histone deacetylase clr3 [Hygrophoropsis aurantiaca]